MLVLLTIARAAQAQDHPAPLITQGFETAGEGVDLPEGWSLFTEFGTVELSTDRAHGGERSLKLIDQDPEHAVGLRSPRVEVAPGEPCWVSCWYYAERDNNQSIYIEFWTAEGGRPERESRSWGCLGRGKWMHYIRRAVVPPGAAFVTVHANSHSANVATGCFDDIEFGTGAREIFDRAPKPPADVRHPCGLYKQADIDRAQGNIERHEWARKVLDSLKSSAEFWMEVPDEDLDYWIPDLTPFRVVDCPACGAGWRFAWTHPDHDSIRCKQCEFTWPNPDYPEDKVHVFLDSLGEKHEIPYYEGTPSTVHGSAASSTYRFSGRVRYGRIGRLSSLGAVGKVYAVTDDVAYAETVRKVLLRLAEVYPHYMAHDWNHVYEDYSNLQSGKLSGWKLHDAGTFIELAAAYDLTYNSGVYSDQDKVAIEEGVFREFARLMTATSPRGCCINDGPFAMGAGALAGLMLADHDTIAWAIEPPDGFIGFLEDYFLRDGHWYEASPSYEGMALARLYVAPEALRGYSDPAGYAEADRYDDLDLLAHPLMSKILTVGAYERMPDGLLPATNDSTFGARYPAQRAEINYYWYPTDENLHLLAWAFGGKPSDSGDEYALFRRDPDIDFSAVEPLDPSSESIVRPDVGWAILRTGDGPTDAALMLDYGPFGSGHGHPDRLNIIYYDHGAELVFDHGYLGWGHPIHPWMRTTLNHNQVIIDGQSQARQAGCLEGFGGRGPVMGVIASAPEVYPDLAEVYRRYCILVDHGPGIRYLVDGFHVRGGTDHQYAFHALAETVTVPELPYVAFDPASLGDAATGYSWLEDAQSADLLEPRTCEWQAGDELATRLHVLPEANTALIHGSAPGLRDRSKPFVEVTMHKVILRRPGPESMFLTVIEGVSGVSGVAHVSELPVKGAGIARAAVVECGDLRDIVIIADEDAGPITIDGEDLPAIRFAGRLACITMREGRVVYLWMLGGSELAVGETTLHAVPGYAGSVLAVDPDAFTVTVDAELPADDWSGEHLIVADRADGVYAIDSAEAAVGGALVRLAGEPIIDIAPGDAFTIMTSARLTVEETDG